MNSYSCLLPSLHKMIQSDVHPMTSQYVILSTSPNSILHILKIQSFGIFRESEYPFLRDARGEIPGPLSFRISSSIESAPLGANYLTLSIVSLNQMYSGIASETTLLILFRLVMRFKRTLQDHGLSMFYGSCTSFEVLELFKVSLQSLILISEAIFVISNDKYREIQSEQHPTSYRVQAYRANVRNTSYIKELRIRGSENSGSMINSIRQRTFLDLTIKEHAHHKLLCDVMLWGVDTQSDMACQQNRELFSIYEAIPYISGQSALPYVAGAF
ncbi:hypothetical protein L2E82_45367 [Cichorium intybus]|uniref:Uncharacterized protein n=1 Tax=Cichorium intybus TaxID=13427 RepID=A0ACB8ZSP0_CICIN|nr:hypothetical protein L2E82_45367 [Cichorium intybus]